MANTKLTKEEKEQWNELYQYVKHEILQYDKSQSIPSTLILRLKGLTTGKYLENRSIEDKAKYSFKIILYTFQICKPQILSAIRGKEFKNEANKFNYICKIVESNINDVYKRVSDAEQSKVKTEEINTDNLMHDGASYQRKTQTKNSKLNDLW
jgi:hypothetical protein